MSDAFNQVFDKEALLDELEGDVDFLAETIVTLQEDAPELFQTIDDGVSRNDAGAIRDAAHTLKGMVSNFCAKASFDVATHLEKTAAAGDLAAVPQLQVALQNEVNRLQQELLNLLASLNGD